LSVEAPGQSAGLIPLREYDAFNSAATLFTHIVSCTALQTMARKPDLSYTIAILKAISVGATTVAFQHSSYANRLINNAVATEVSRRDRGSTPAVEFAEASMRLLLRDREKPFDPQAGFEFGSGVETEQVDIILHPVAGQAGISRRHFSINFNWETKALLTSN